MDKKDMSLADYMKMYRDEKHKMVSISQSINAKERKIAQLKEEYHALAVETQKLGWKKITVNFDDFKGAMQKHFKNKGVVVDVELPKIKAPQEGEWSKENILYNMKAEHKDWMKITAYTRYDCEEIYYPIVLSAPQADGKELKDHIKIKKISRGDEKFYQLVVDENVLTFVFSFDACVKFDRGTLMFAKTAQGSILRYLLEKENAVKSDSEEAKEV